MGPQNFRGFPYLKPRDGFWGEPTSTLNFCEEDYVLSYYCAEVCNTVTNIIFAYLGYKGIRACIRYSHPPIFVISFIGYMIVGLGSTFFHATLKYQMQLVDELSMIYTTCVMLLATFSYARSTRFAIALTVSLIGLSWFITSKYYHTKDPRFHQDAYAALTIVVVFSNMFLMEKSVRPSLQKRELARNPAAKGTPATDSLLHEMWCMVAMGITVFISGFLLWNLDNVYCHTFRAWRHKMLLPWAVLLEGHAWWHLLTGVGAYYYITWRIWIHRCLDGDEDKFRLVWPSLLSFPEVVAMSALPQSQNGSLAQEGKPT